MFLEAENVTVTFGRRRVLDDLSMRLQGRSTGLLGPNGAGKSTFIKALLGFVPLRRGTIRVLGHDVRRQAMHIRSLVGYMPEHESYIEGLSAVRLLRYLGELSGLSPRDAMERAHESLHYVGLGELRYRPVETYSLGNQQRVKLAQAIVHGPKILILDEPTNALDPEGRNEMLRLVRDIGEYSGSHVIMCSHILRDVEYCCESVTVLNRGRAILSGVIEELKKEDIRTYEVRVEGNRDGFERELVRHGCLTSQNTQGHLRVQLPEGYGTRYLFEIAQKAGVQLRHFHFKKDSLEDIFVSALQESERGHGYARP